MKVADAKSLISSPQLQSDNPQTWADMGCGKGIFTSALSELLPAGSFIYAVDKSPQTLIKTSQDITVEFILSDFEKKDFDKTSLDGILMANSLHFISDKPGFLKRIKSILKPGGKFLLVEYDDVRANRWVPFPIPFEQAISLFREAGFKNVTKTGTMPSIYHSSGIYACLMQ